MAAVAVTLEGLGIALYFSLRPFSTLWLFPLILGIHVAASFLFSLAIYIAAKRLRHSSPENWFIVGSVMCLSFSGLGFVFFAAVFISITLLAKEKEGAYSEYEKYITYDFEPEKKYMPSDKLDEGIREELEVSPLVDLLEQKNTNGRRGVINIIQKLPRKDAVHLLKKAMTDKSVDVRYMATAALSKIENEFNENIFMARKETLRDAESADSHLALANAYAEYYDSGLLDKVTSAHYRQLAVDEYEKSLKLGGENVHVLNYLANLDLIVKDYDSAFLKFRKAADKDPDDIYAHVGLIQTYYETDRIREAIKHARTLVGKMPETKGIMKEIINYWAS